MKQIDFSQLALVNGRNEQSAASIHFAKTHRGLINAFSEHLTKDGTLPRDLGRSLKRAEEMRLLADYDGDSVGMADAMTMVSDAKIFISAIEKLTV